MKLKYKLISLLTLFSGSLGIIHLINKFIFLKATHNSKSISEEHNIYKWNLGDINYIALTSGNKKPLLILHDISAYSNSSEWLGIAKKLSKKHSVYIPDLIGCGHSSKPDTNYISYIYTQLISDFSKDIISGTCDVVAYGKSAESIIEALALNPDKFDKVILVSPTSLEQKPYKLSKLLHFILNTPIIGTFIYNLIMSKNNIHNNFTKKVSHKYFISDKLIELYYNNAHIGKSPKSLYKSMVSNYIKNDSKKSLSNSNHSISILYGSEDKEGPFIKDMYNYVNKNVESCVIKRAKLMPHIENPTELVDLIETYLI